MAMPRQPHSTLPGDLIGLNPRGVVGRWWTQLGVKLSELEG